MRPASGVSRTTFAHITIWSSKETSETYPCNSGKCRCETIDPRPKRLGNVINGVEAPAVDRPLFRLRRDGVAGWAFVAGIYDLVSTVNL